MKIQRFYLDTSIFGGVFDEEFKEYTIPLFEMIKRGEAICLYSDLTERELINAPQNVVTFFGTLPKKYMSRAEVTDDAVILAQNYLDENVVGKTSRDDCLHIATATCHNADMLVSWNFKHIVNIFRIRGYNSVNIRYGYHPLEIRSPKEIMIWK